MPCQNQYTQMCFLSAEGGHHVSDVNGLRVTPLGELQGIGGDNPLPLDAPVDVGDKHRETAESAPQAK